MKKLVFYIILVLMPIVAWGQNQSAIIKKMGQACAEMKTMECDFTQTKHLKILKNQMVSQGRMHYQQPNKLRWEYTTPYTYTFILNNNQVMLKNSRRTDVIDVNQNKIFKEIARMMIQSIDGRCLTDQKSFKTTVKETPQEWLATLVPQKKDVKQMWTRLVLHFDRQQNLVTQVEMYEKSGDYTVIELQQPKVNKSIAAQIFSVK